MPSLSVLSSSVASLAMALAAVPALAGTLQVQVTDATGKPLAGAVVFADSPEARAALKPAEGVRIVQRNKQFEPQVSLVPVGTAVSFPNEDTVRHHVYSFSPAKKFEIKLYVGTPAAPVVFDKPGIAVLGCNIHDHMAAWVLVLETPHVARTAADGQATLAQLPAGSYTLRAWHPLLPPGSPAAEQAVTVAATPVRATFRLGGGA